MKAIQIRTIFCAIVMLFTFTLSAENFSNPKNDPSACPAFNSKQKKHNKKNHKLKSASNSKGKTAQHCAAY